MRNFVLIFFIFTTWLAVQSVRAESANDMCGMDTWTEPNGDTVVACASCTTQSDYALAGAAAAKTSGLTEIVVQSPDGATEFHVTMSPAYKNASATVGGSVGVASGSVTTPVVDHNAMTVTAYPMRGSAAGPNFGPPNVPNSTIARKCKTLAENSAEAIGRSIRNTQSARDYVNQAILDGIPVVSGGGSAITPRRKTKVCTISDGMVTCSIQ